MDNAHLLLEIISDFSASLIELIKDMDKNLQASLGLSFLHEVFHHVYTGKNHALASPSHMGKEAMLNWVIL